MNSKKHARPPTGPSVELEIGEIGARGDGVARHPEGPVFVPFTVPGDRVLARLDRRRGEGRVGVVERWLAEGAGRAVPVCRHFGTCGGCALQHLDEAHYAEAKLDLVRSALKRHGLGDVPVAPVRLLPPGTRRRARFSLARSRDARARPQVGFAERASHRLVDLTECAVLAPRLFAFVGPLRELASELLQPGEGGHASLQGLASDVDLLLDVPRIPDLHALEALAAFATTQDLARLSWRRSADPTIVPVAQRRPVQAHFAGIAVEVPPDAFLQATAAAEEALTEAVLAALPDARRVADLFAGIGTFSFALAARGRVHAVEGWPPAVAALRAAARRAGLDGRITAEERDLEERPLQPEELQEFDAVVFDPPRNGARAQATELAGSRVPRVVAISCNPATFARDARLLVDGGYRLIGVQPIDQFVWSPHLELVAAFER